MTHKPNKNDTKQPYSAWLNSPEAVNHLKTQIEKVGYPLEVAVRKIFQKNNYEISNAYYLHPNEGNNSNIRREIDIYSSKKFSGFDIKGCKVSFRVFVIGDCKYSSTIDLFAFRSDSGKLTPSFPIIYNAENFFESKANQYFKFPMIAQHISEIDVASSKFHSNEMNIYDACYQAINAFEYFVPQYRLEVMKENYVNIRKRTKVRNWLKEHEESTKKREIEERYSSTPENEIDEKEKMYSEQYLSNVKDFEIVVGIPLIVIGENNGFLEVRMKEEKVDGFTDTGYGVYLFAPNIISPSLAALMKESSQIPVVIANLKMVERCLKDIEDGIHKMIHHAMLALNANPRLIYRDVREFIESEGLQSFVNQ